MGEEGPEMVTFLHFSYPCLIRVSSVAYFFLVPNVDLGSGTAKSGYPTFASLTDRRIRHKRRRRQRRRMEKG